MFFVPRLVIKNQYYVNNINVEKNYLRLNFDFSFGFFQSPCIILFIRAHKLPKSYLNRSA